MMKKPTTLEIYEKQAEYFSRARNSNIQPERKYLDRMIGHLQRGDAILDIGCGTGKPIAEYLIQQGFQITGVDGAVNMIQIATRNFPDQKWQVADMRTLNLGQQFQGAIAWDSFFHLTQEEQRNMFPLFARHLASQGILIFTSGTEHGIAMGSMNGDELFHSSLSTEEYRQLLEKHGFQVLDHQMNDPTCGGHTVWTAQKIT